VSFFIFGGFRSDAAGLLVERKNTLGLPARDVEKIHVPGRSGDVLIDHGSYQNVRVTYDCAARDVAALDLLRQALTSGSSYRLLTDSYGPWQRLALFASALDIGELVAQRAYRFTLAFDCKPQRWADRAQSVTGGSSVTVVRPAACTRGDPRIEITGTGNVTLTTPQGNIVLGTLTGSAVVDSEAMVAYRNNTNGTRTAIDVPYWPQLTAASTTITSTGGVTGLKIYPNWWSL
jgi:phage-related protein